MSTPSFDKNAAQQARANAAFELLKDFAGTFGKCVVKAPTETAMFIAGAVIDAARGDESKKKKGR